MKPYAYATVYIALVFVISLLSKSAIVQASASGKQASTISQSTSPPSLQDIRDELALYESSIVSAYLARRTLSPTYFFEGEKQLTLEALVLLANLEVTDDDDSSAKVSDDVFDRGPLEYVFYPRDKAAFGDTSNSQRGTIFNALFESAAAPNPHRPATSQERDSQARMRPPASLLDASLLSTISARISLGRQVAQAKVAADRSLYCNNGREPMSDAVKIRQSLTVPTQVEAVKKSVSDKFTKWSATTPTDADVQRFVSFFERIIDVTTDVEVYTIVSNQAGC